MLHITNGDAVAEKLAETDLAADVLPWRDVLHEGPVPAGLSLEDTSIVRAAYLASCGWGSHDETLASFRRRDQRLRRMARHEEVLLWFEHDLFDQLQLLQLLDWFSDSLPLPTRVTLICINAYPGIDPFHGLGQLSAEQLEGLMAGRRDVDEPMLDQAHRAWEAFRSPHPTVVQRLLKTRLEALPYVTAALERQLEQFPSTTNGLSRTERQILEELEDGPLTLADLFGRVAEREEARFMGDSVFWLYVERLTEGHAPVVAIADGQALGRSRGSQEGVTDLPARKVILTDTGRTVLAGEADWISLVGKIDRWLGGVHLVGSQPRWRWDRETQSVKEFAT